MTCTLEPLRNALTCGDDTVMGAEHNHHDSPQAPVDVYTPNRTFHRYLGPATFVCFLTPHGSEALANPSVPKPPRAVMSAELAEMVLRCEKTGKLFFSEKEAKVHNEETGLSDFAQVGGAVVGAVVAGATVSVSAVVGVVRRTHRHRTPREHTGPHGTTRCQEPQLAGF